EAGIVAADAEPHAVAGDAPQGGVVRVQVLLKTTPRAAATPAVAMPRGRRIQTVVRCTHHHRDAAIRAIVANGEAAALHLASVTGRKPSKAEHLCQQRRNETIGRALAVIFCMLTLLREIGV